MSFYIRKRIQVGPLRFNISRHGVGVSTGMRGFRVGTGPHGSYVSLAEHGIYYRKGLDTEKEKREKAERRAEKRGARRTTVPAQIEEPRQAQPLPLVQIESAEALALTDSSAAELLDEMNRKLRHHSLWPWALVLSLILLGLLVYAAFPPLTLLVLAGVLLVVVLVLHSLDQVRRTTVMLYHLDEPAEQAYQAFYDAVQGLNRCAMVWHVQAEALPDAQTMRQNAGAKTMVRRAPVRWDFGSPRYVKTNIAAPFIPVGRQTLYFFPDRVLVIEGREAGAVPYGELESTAENAEFVEMGPIPRDAKPAGTAWEVENKSGEPDKRYKNNRQFPLLLYSTLHLTSKSGLNEMLQFSRPDVGEDFVNAVERLGEVRSSQDVQDKKEDGQDKDTVTSNE